MPHVPGHDDPNLLSRILGWEVPGADRMQYGGWRGTRAGPALDFASRALIPGAETARMAQGGDASTMGLLGSTALDFLPMGAIGGGLARAGRGVLPSGILNLMRAPFNYGADALSKLRGNPYMVPIRYKNLPDAETTREMMRDNIATEYWNLDMTPSIDFSGQRVWPKDPISALGGITTNPSTPWTRSRNWLTGMEEPGISVYQGLKFPKGSKNPLLQSPDQYPNPFIVERRAPNVQLPVQGRTSTNNPLISQNRYWKDLLVHQPNRGGIPSYELDADFIPGVQGSDLESMVNEASIRNVRKIQENQLFRQSPLNIGGLDETFAKYDQFGQLINPPWYGQVGNMDFPVSRAATSAATMAPFTATRAATIPDSQPTRTYRTPAELTPRNYNPTQFETDEPQKVSGTPNPKFNRPVDMATARKKRDEDWNIPGSY